MPADPRFVTFEACFNFRDLGGYRTTDGRTIRPGALYRSDSLHRLLLSELDAFTGLGLRTVIDLRSPAEVSDHGALRDEGRRRLTWHHVALFDGQMSLAAPPAMAPGSRAEPDPPSPPGTRYLHSLGDGVGVARVFRILGGEGALPALFHCTSGKDRTGIVAAMVLDLLGVDDDVIAHDYLLTNETRDQALSWIAEHEPDFAAYLAQFPPERLHVRADTILGFLASVRARHGSVERLLLAAGVTPEQLTFLRGALLAG